MPDALGVILAGGRGTRFRPYSDLIIKPMVPVGPGEYPILHLIVSWLARYGVRDLVILAGYRWRQIYNYFRDGSCHGVRIRYSLDDDEYKGTGGALLKAYLSGLLDKDTLLVWYGDILAEIDVEELLGQHHESGAHATIVVARGYRVPVGIAKVEDGRVVRLEEKPVLPVHATIGVLVLDRRVMEEARSLPRSHDIMADLIPRLIEKGYNVRAYVYEKPWYDLASLERYVKLPHEELRDFLNPGQAGTGPG